MGASLWSGFAFARGMPVKIAEALLYARQIWPCLRVRVKRL